MSNKRGAGEGVIHQRESDGRWTAAVELPRATDGSRQRKWVYGKTRKEVAEKLKALQATIDSGVDVRKSGITVERLAADWLNLCVKPSTRIRTYQSYELMMQTHILPRFGKKKVTALSAFQIDAFLREKESQPRISAQKRRQQDTKPLSPRTVSYIRSILRQMLNQAIRWEIVTRNVAELSTPPKSNTPELPDFTMAQIHRLCTSFQGHRYETVYLLLLGLGLRLGEALGLRWEDVELDDNGGGCIHVLVQLQFLEGEYRLTPPKSNSGKRTICLPPFLVTALRSRQSRQREEAAASGAVWCNSLNLVNTNLTGGPLDEARVRQRFKELLTANGLPEIRLHDCRHLAASLLVQQNVHPRMIMAVLGHSQISLTMNRYSHIMPSATQAAADALETVLGGEAHRKSVRVPAAPIIAESQ